MKKIEGVYQFKISGFGKIVELLKDKNNFNNIIDYFSFNITCSSKNEQKKRLRRKRKKV